MFYLIDKPLGITSFDAIRMLRKSLQIKKMGHSGSKEKLSVQRRVSLRAKDSGEECVLMATK